jgi:hypothetical protein
LHRLCGWAWYAAIGPLLDEHLPREHPITRGWVPRLALVPTGELARVPWHAAQYQDATGVRYAVERAAFSTAVSARMLCDTAHADELPLTRSGLVIGDPDTGGVAPQLPAALREALAIKKAFYPRARYHGRTAERVPVPGRTGTRAQVPSWLADRGVYAGHDAARRLSRCGPSRDGARFAS